MFLHLSTGFTLFNDPAFTSSIKSKELQTGIFFAHSRMEYFFKEDAGGQEYGSECNKKGEDI